MFTRLRVDSTRRRRENVLNGWRAHSLRIDQIREAGDFASPSEEENPGSGKKRGREIEAAKDKGGASPSPTGLGSGHRDVGAEINVLNGVE